MIRFNLRLLIVLVGSSLMPLDSAVNVDFPRIQEVFGLDDAAHRAHMVWLPTVVMVASVLMLFFVNLRVVRSLPRWPVFGRLASARDAPLWLIFRIGLALSLVAFVLATWSLEIGTAFELTPRQSYAVLLAARTLQGIAAALTLGFGPALTAASLPAERRTSAAPLFIFTMGLAMAAGPAVAGVLSLAWDWPAVFGFRAVMAAALLVVAIGVPAPAPGGIEDANWAYAAAALRTARRVRFPVGAFAANFATFAIILLVPYYLIEFHGMSRLAAGLALAVFALSIALSTYLGRIVLQGPIRILEGTFALGMALVIVGLYHLALWHEHTMLFEVVLTLIVPGLGLGLVVAANLNILLASFGAERAAVISNLQELTRTGGNFAAAVGILVFFPWSGLASFQHVFLALPTILLAVVLVAVPLRWLRPPPAAPGGGPL